MEFTELLKVLEQNPAVLAKVKSLLTNNRLYKKTENPSLCLCCQQNVPDWFDLCNPCLDAGEIS